MNNDESEIPRDSLNKDVKTYEKKNKLNITFNQSFKVEF